MPQYGFFFDQSRCVHCSTCAVACKSWNLLSPGPEQWLRMFEWDEGQFPNLRTYSLFAPCYHCENPVCVDAANGAMYKEPKYGAVLIDPAKATSANLKAAWNACLYGAIVFNSDAPDSKASKCTLCVDRLEQGKLPVCVDACPMRALDFGPLADLQKKYGVNRDLHGLPDSTTVKPAVVFKPSDARKQLVPYPADKAFTLLAARDIRPVFQSPSDVTADPAKIAGRQKLVLKPSSTKDLMRATMDDYS